MAISRTEQLEQRVAPVTLAKEQLLPVPDALLPLFPMGGLQQGWSVGVSGAGSWSLALALLGSAAGADGWSACVGLEELGLVAADEIGVRLDRLIMVETPPPQQWAAVVASLVEAVDVVCLGSARSIGVRDARRLMARAREQRAVLLHLDGGRSWPQALDVTLSTEPGSWSGIGPGHGHLATRPLSVTAVGRRSMAKPRRVEVLLPGPGGGLAPTGPSRPVGELAVAGPVDGPAVGSVTGEVGRWPVSA